MYTLHCSLASVAVWCTTNSSDLATALSSFNRRNETRDFNNKIQRPPASDVTQYTIIAKPNFTSGNIFCWGSWLRQCATSRKVAGSIPDGVIEIFHWHNPSGRTMAQGLTQLLKEMSNRNISWGKRRPARRADNFTTFMCRLSWNLGASTSWNPQGLSRPVVGLIYLFKHILLTLLLKCISRTPWGWPIEGRNMSQW